MVLGKLDSYVLKKKKYIKNKLKPNVRPDAIKLLLENIGTL